MAEVLSGKRLEILHFISECQQDRGYPPSVREICTAVGLASTATVHSHLAVLQKEGYLEKDPTKPRALTVRFDPSSKAQLPMGRSRSVPLVGTVAAGTGVLAQENVEELYALPEGCRQRRVPRRIGSDSGARGGRREGAKFGLGRWRTLRGAARV